MPTDTRDAVDINISQALELLDTGNPHEIYSQRGGITHTLSQVVAQRDALRGKAYLIADGAMSINDAVAWSGVGRSLLYIAMSEGDLPFIKVGRRRLIPKRGLKMYLASGLEGGG